MLGEGRGRSVIVGWDSDTGPGGVSLGVENNASNCGDDLRGRPIDAMKERFPRTEAERFLELGSDVHKAVSTIDVEQTGQTGPAAESAQAADGTFGQA